MSISRNVTKPYTTLFAISGYIDTISNTVIEKINKITICSQTTSIARNEAYVRENSIVESDLDRCQIKSLLLDAN